jgi:outer membrane protein assembly factor BamB
VLWRAKTGTSTASPLVHGDYLYWVAGSVACLRTDNGKTVYKETLYEGRNEYVSAVAIGDKLYALTRFDGLYVLATGDTFRELAHNTFPGDDSIFNASPAVSDGRLYIRSNAYLYCIGASAK